MKFLFMIFMHIRVHGIANNNPPITSEKKCTPKYILEKPINIAKITNDEKYTIFIKLFVFFVTIYQSNI